MKKFPFLFLSVFVWLFSINTGSAQLYSKAPDFLAAPTFRELYLDYINEVSEKVFSGAVKVYTDASMTNSLPVADRAGYLTINSDFEVLDENTNEFVVITIQDTLRGENWEGIHFDLAYVAIKVNEYKWLYLPNKEKSKLNKQKTLLLEKLQSEARLDLINSENIGKEAYQVYDALQKRIYNGIKAGKLPIYTLENINLAMSLSHFDTAFDIIETLVTDNGDSAMLEEVRYDFTENNISGCGLQGSFVETGKGWQLNVSHYSILYTPVLAGMQFPPQFMCLIKSEDLKSFLTDEDWLFFQELWNFTLQEKIKNPLDSSNF